MRLRGAPDGMTADTHEDLDSVALARRCSTKVAAAVDGVPDRPNKRKVRRVSGESRCQRECRWITLLCRKSPFDPSRISRADKQMEEIREQDVIRCSGETLAQ